jgi:alkyl sulfatase BDS1-like metallo-beta-lactamase superfamily hydrolase
MSRPHCLWRTVVKKILILTLLLAACGKHQQAAAPLPVKTPADLAAHSAEFKREVIKVTDGVWSAVGWGAANSILVEGTDGVIIVDTTITEEHGREVLAEFRKVTSKPVKALIYTHSHPDHTSGASVFAEGAAPDLPIYAQEGVARTIDKIATEFQPVLTQRAVRMYGSLLSPGEMVNIGIGPEIGFDEESHIHTLRPNHSFAEQLEDTVAGVHFQLVHAPGETDDQLFVWLPEKRTLLCGDNFYRSFPNLYTIRGTTYRDLKGWAASLDKMRALKPAFLVPSHTRPLTGEDLINTELTNYRDAVAYVYQQTVRMINQDMTPSEIAARITLPAHLAKDPFLQEFYGTARWSARSVFAGNVGWFDGRPSTLDPLSPDVEAQKFVELAGGEEALTNKILEASQRGEHQWVLQMSDRALRTNEKNEKVRQARVASLIALGEAASNPNARHWYLTKAHELRDGLKIPKRFAKPEPGMLHDMPVAGFFDAMAVNLHAEDTLELNQKVGFDFSDSGEKFTLIVRRGVVEVQPRLLDDDDLRVRVPAQVFKEMLAKLRNPALTLAKDFEVTKGNKLELAKFFKLFDPGD